MDAERRRLRRAPVRLMAIVKVLSTGKAWRALTKDVSGSGMSFVTDEALEPGTPLEIEMRLPDHDSPIRVIAGVVWMRSVKEPKHMYEHFSMEIGVKFVSLSPQDQKLLTQYGTLNAPPAPDS